MTASTIVCVCVCPDSPSQVNRLLSRSLDGWRSRIPKRGNREKLEASGVRELGFFACFCNGQKLAGRHSSRRSGWRWIPACRSLVSRFPGHSTRRVQEGGSGA